MLISDGSSDVCSSDLLDQVRHLHHFVDVAEHLADAALARAAVDHLGRHVECRLTIKNRRVAGPFAGVRARKTPPKKPRASLAGRRQRSEERRVGKEGVSTCRYRW